MENVDRLENMDNRGKILECALDLFYKKGYDAVGVQEIVEAAGITKPTMYYYFKSKFGLLETLLADKCKIMNERLRKASEYQRDLIQTLEAFARELFSMAAEDSRFYYLMFSFFYSAKENETHHAIRPYMQELFFTVQNIFEKASNELGNMNGRQEQFAVGFIGILNSYLLVYYEREYVDGNPVNNHIIYSLVHQFMHGIYA
ncbi:MAG TPA: TetR/AcrR family transcriptional regulator [Lachnospiraceae bacterium]|nr:TetR/AcrR family transcriptional regulator [Lachnospiraceae bacterium]